MGLSINSLPNELLFEILHTGFSSEFEFSYLWTTLRNVCQLWRFTVDELVKRVHLDKMYLTYYLTNAKLGHAYFAKPFWLCFFALDKTDDRIAILRPDKVLCSNPGDESWLTNLKTTLQRADAKTSPAHIFSVIRHVNDTELCDFELREPMREAVAWEIRLDWRASITKLMIEDKYRQRLSNRWILEKREQAAGLSETNIIARGLQMQRLSRGEQRDESFRKARMRRMGDHFGPALIKQFSGPDLTMARKANEIEEHQSLINNFSF